MIDWKLPDTDWMIPNPDDYDTYFQYMEDAFCAPVDGTYEFHENGVSLVKELSEGEQFILTEEDRKKIKILQINKRLGEL